LEEVVEEAVVAISVFRQAHDPPTFSGAKMGCPALFAEAVVEAVVVGAEEA
jgi:hypothetical protein